MRTQFVVFLISLLPVSSALAAATWQGPYAGAYLGGGFGSNHFSTNAGTVTGASYFTTNADVNAVNTAGSSQHSPAAAIVGVQAGHDWVWRQMTYGVAVDYSVLPLSSSKSVTNVFPDSSDTYSVFTSMSTNWLFTLRGRVGYQAMWRWQSLLYLTAGMAMTKLSVNNSYSDNSSLAGLGGSNTSANQIGWTAGAGVELAVFGNATLDLEYLYIRIPSLNAAASISNSAAGFGVSTNSQTSPFTTTGSFDSSVLRLGINYRFDE